MASCIFAHVLDEGLSALDTEATGIYICDSEPASFTDATTDPTSGGSMLGSKVFGAGGCFGAPADAIPNGRKVSSVAIGDGNVLASGTAGYWAACDTVNSRLLARGTLQASQNVTSGNTFSLASFDVRIPGE